MNRPFEGRRHSKGSPPQSLRLTLGASSRRDLLAGSVVVVAGAALAGPPMPPELAARGAVEALLNDQREAWNRGDLEAFCVHYADDAVFLSPSGLTKGRAEVLARYKKKYGGKAETMGTLSFEPFDVKASLDVVTMAMRWKLEWKDKPAASGLTLIVWTRLKEQWKLSQDASM